MKLTLLDLVFLAGLGCALVGCWRMSSDAGLVGTGAVTCLMAVVWRRVELAAEAKRGRK